jgi:outer membrane lipoprotein
MFLGRRNRAGTGGKNENRNALDIAPYLRKNKFMKINRLYVLLLLAMSLILSSCAPVLSRTYMREGQRAVSFADLRENPDQYKGQLFILGGIIVKTKFTEAGSRIEAVHVPVDGYGYFKDQGRSEGRFLAILPKDGTMLDPEVYGRGRRITLAGEFVATRKGMIDEMEYVYPVFEIKQIYLWPKERRYNPSPYYYDPWFYPYPYYYGDPWWNFYYYPGYPRPVTPPVYRRTPPPNQPPFPSPQPRKEREPEHER